MAYQGKPGAYDEDKPRRSWWSSWWRRPDEKAEARRLDNETESAVPEDNQDYEDDGAKQRAGKK